MTGHRAISCFVTGTDTGVGKTHLTRLMVESLRAEGRDAAGFNPVSCGDRDDGLEPRSSGPGGLPGWLSQHLVPPALKCVRTHTRIVRHDINCGALRRQKP